MIIQLQLVFFSKNNKSRSQNKNINILFHCEKENERNEVFIKHISTNLIITNPMTKVVPTYKDHVNCMGLANSFNI